MRVAIVGSRKRTDRDSVSAFVESLPVEAVVVSGGCEGPDKFAADAARKRGLTVVEHLPDLTGCSQRFEFTKRFYERNQRVVDDSERVAAFVAPDRKGGTEDTIKRAAKAGKPVVIL